MNIFYIPLLFICIAGDCKFYQSINYSHDEQECKKEVVQRTTKAKAEGAITAEGVCVNVNFEELQEYTPYKTQSVKLYTE